MSLQQISIHQKTFQQEEAGHGTPVLLDGTTTFAEARRVFVCRKVYTAMLQKDGFVRAETYEKWYGKEPLHREFIGEILACYERKQ